MANIPEIWSTHLMRTFIKALGAVRIVGTSGTLRVEKSWFNQLREFFRRV